MNFKIINKATFLLICILSQNLFAIHLETYTGIKAQSMVHNAEKVVTDSRLGTIKQVVLTSGNGIRKENVKNWLINAVFKVNSSTEFKLVSEEVDKLGYTHQKLQQYFLGVKVENGIYIVHFFNHELKSANGEFYKISNLQIQPSFDKNTAFKKAKAVLVSEKYIWENSVEKEKEFADRTELVILRTDQTYKLSYKTDIYSLKPLFREYLFIDAQTGEKIKSVNRIHNNNSNGTAVTRYHGTQSMKTDSLASNSFRLRETFHGTGINTLDLNNSTSYISAVDFTNTSNYWNSTSLDNAAYDAHWGTGKTFDYFKLVHGRNSFDNANALVESFVHYNSSYVNAFWDGSVLTYGDGDGSTYDALTSIEIVAHEFTHAVTEYSAGLIYSDESGALNEGTSDIFGVVIDYYANPTTANFLMADNIALNGNPPFRNFANPNLTSNPDTYLGDFWDLGGEVHYNSTVYSHWFYLLTYGGFGTNDNGDNFSVNSIGMDAAAEIVYRALTLYMTPNTTYDEARIYTLQAATDLFGSCSNQLVQASNAWYAVGIGTQFSNAVSASFSVNNNYACIIPASFQFINNSINSTSFIWNFGDGTTSTLVNPTHTYAAPGQYNVQLIALGATLCNSSDTLLQNAFITVTNTGGPVAACNVSTTSTCCGYGITNVSFQSINNSSSIATEGCMDFTCTDIANLIAGDPYIIKVTTGNSQNENLKVWIDYDNNGVFNNTNELEFTSNSLYTHNGIIQTPTNATLNTPLRMRVSSAQNAPTGACVNLVNGQTEDYTVIFSAASLPPEANFIAVDTTIIMGTSLQFYDLSSNVPTSWQWTFTGAQTTTSTLQNPMVVYNAIGVFPVKLKVTNSLGNDSLIKIGYIQVVNSFNMCGSAISSSGQSGLIYDSGGPTGTYQDGEYCSFLINPICANEITLSFTSFNTESCCDALSIYDGATTSAPLIGSYGGSTIPSTIVANSGQMLLVFDSDGSITSSGFSASWTSLTYGNTPITAEFVANDYQPPLNTSVQFNDASNSTPISWLWDFGDGTTATTQNPSHSFTTPGLKNVTLTATNCSYSDTVIHQINVQVAPIFSMSPHNLNISLNCTNDSLSLPIYINNGNGGQLSVNFGSSYIDTLEVLAMTYGTDPSTEYPNTFTAVNNYFNAYNLTATNTTLAATLQNELVGKHILILPEPESSSTTVYNSLAPIVQTFMSNGGTVIACGAANSYISNLGLFTGVFYLNVGSGSMINNVNPSHPIMQNIGSTFSGPNATFLYTITDPAKIDLATSGTSSMSCFKNVGLGRAVLIGFDFFEITTENSKMLANVFEWVKNNPSFLTNTIDVSPDSATINANSSQTFYATFEIGNLNGGSYTEVIYVSTNDPLHPLDSIVCTINISNTPCAEFESVISACGGLVNFTDESNNNPTTYLWDFGDGNSSTLANPSHSYATSGTYIVTLNVGNSFGFSTSSQQITVNYNNCNLMCSSLGSTNSTGSLYDSGGPLGNYTDNENCSFLIHPPCASSVTLTLLNLSLGTSTSDFIRVYNGIDATGVLLGTFYYYSALTSVTANSGSIYIQFFSNTSINNPGFELSWNSVLISNPPIVAAFNMNTITPPLNGSVIFSDLSSNQPVTWLWNFGDGNTSTAQNPTHNYLTPGLKTITMIASNCSYSDTIIHTLTVQQAPTFFSFNPQSLTFNMNCSDDSVSIPFSINSGNGGDLVTNFNNYGTDTLEVLALTYGADLANEYPNTLTAINNYFGAYHLSAISLINPIDISAALVGKHVLLIPEPETATASQYTSLSSIFLNFMNSGGTIIACGSTTPYIINAGLFTGSYGTLTTSTVNNVNSFDPIMNGIPATFIAPDASYLYTITNADKISLVKSGSYDLVCYRNVGSGKAIYVGFDYYSSNLNSEQIIGNCFQTILNNGNLNGSVSVNPPNSVQSNNSTQTFTATYVVNGQAAGAYQEYIYINTNDPLHPLDSILCNINISSQPCADFTYTIQPCTNTINFTSTSTNSPTSYLWDFGDATTSALQNPTHTFTSGGTYIVTLTVSNSSGTSIISDTLVLSGQICANMCSSTSNASSTGNLFDSGGQTGAYQNSENCSFLINPSCATSVTINFTSFSTESGYDYLRIYNGSSASAPQLAVISGSASTTSYTASSGQMFLVFSSDGSYTGSGFAATWTSVIAGGSPISATITASNINPPLSSSVDFSFQATSTPSSFSWNFGDGTFSNLPNPSHSYSTPGNKTVTFILSNCLFADTITQIINVQAAPYYSVDPTTAYINLDCNSDSVIVPITVFNGNGGQLEVSFPSQLIIDTLEVLALTYGVDLTDEYPNTINAINTYFNAYHLTTTNSINSTSLANALIGKHVLLMPEPENSLASEYSAISTLLQNFVTNGGTIIACGSTKPYLVNAGLFTGTYISYTDLTINNVNPTHPIMSGIPLTFNAPNGSYYFNYTNSDLVSLVEYSGYDLVTLRPIGNGRVIYLGFDYFESSIETRKIIANAFEWARSLNSITNNTLEVVPSQGTIPLNSNQIFNVVIDVDDFVPGTTFAEVIVFTNDPLHPTDTITIYFSVNPLPCIDFQIPNCGMLANFDSHTLVPVTSYLWDFGDSYISTLQSPFHNYTSTGTYTVTLTTTGPNGGGTSTQTINITNIPFNPPVITGGPDICSNGTLILGTAIAYNDYQWSTGALSPSLTINAPGAYTVTVSNADGCSAIGSIIINEILINIGVTQSSGNLTSNETAIGASYQWINCSNNTAISGANSISYMPNASGNYAVVINKNGCTDTSACYNVTVIGLKEIGNTPYLSLKPNPAFEYTQLEGSGIKSGEYFIQLQSIAGQEIYNKKLLIEQGKFKESIDLSNISSGLYFLTFKGIDTLKVFKVEKIE
jgi:PKD repeat protein